MQGGFGICSTLSVDISATEEEEACQLSVSVQRRVMERCGILLLHTFVFSVFLFCFFVFCFHEALCDGMECCGVLKFVCGVLKFVCGVLKFVCAFVWIGACRSVMESCEFRLGRFRSAVLDLASLIRAA